MRSAPATAFPPGRARARARYVNGGFREGMHVMARMNERYRKFVDKIRDPAEARRRVVECARRHGVSSAARWSGAHPVTVLRLVKRADEGRPIANDPGGPLARAERRRIVEAKRAHPDEGVGRLFTNRRVPYCYRTVFRVLHEAGLTRKQHIPTRDPDFWIRWHEKQRLFAQINFYLGMIARLRGYTGRIADTEGPLRRMRLSERKLELWRAKREGERSPPDAIVTSAVPGRPGTDPDPDRAGESGMTDAEMIASLASGAELAASALERTLADIQDKG